MEPVATIVAQLHSSEILEELKSLENSTSSKHAAQAAARLRISLTVLKKHVRPGHALVGESLFEAFLDPFKKGLHTEVLREYVFPVLFYLDSLADLGESTPAVKNLLKAPWADTALLTMYTHFALVLAKAEMLNTRADGTRGFTWEWRGESLRMTLATASGENPYRWPTPLVATLAEALAAVKQLLNAIRCVLGLGDAPTHATIAEDLPDDVLATPAYQEGDAAFECLKVLAQEAFREGTAGGIAGYYRNRFSDNAIGLDGPDDERLYTTDSFDVVIVDGRMPAGDNWKYVYQPKTRQGMFCVMPA